MSQAWCASGVTSIVALQAIHFVVSRGDLRISYNSAIHNSEWQTAVSLLLGGRDFTGTLAATT